MIHSFPNFSLRHYNSFGIDTRCNEFIVFEELTDLISYDGDLTKAHFLGGGSNMLFRSAAVPSIFLYSKQGQTVIKENGESIDIRVNAAENWHEFVKFCVGNGYGGIENLSLIPGTVGAAPIQNIGAYGVELRDVMIGLTALDRDNRCLVYFDRDACGFGYRDSIFKSRDKGKYLILSVDFRLTKGDHDINTAYGAINLELAKAGKTKPTISDVSTAVIAIRQRKLYDPQKVGNCGSFFKNPIVELSQLELIKSIIPDLKSYLTDDNKLIKLPAAQLIETAGWKDKSVGGAAVSPKHALVLINKNGATGEDVYKLSESIMSDIDDRYGVQLEREVNIL